MKLTDKPLKIEGEACGKRIIDSLYKSNDQYYFLDTGWTEASSHPDHCIGKLIKSGKEKWTFKNEWGDEFIVTPINDQDRAWNAPMIEGYYGWKKYLSEKYPDSDGARFIRRDFGLPDIKEVIKFVDIF